jgi:hypothetical protein
MSGAAVLRGWLVIGQVAWPAAVFMCDVAARLTPGGRDVALDGPVLDWRM